MCIARSVTISRCCVSSRRHKNLCPMPKGQATGMDLDSGISRHVRSWLLTQTTPHGCNPLILHVNANALCQPGGTLSLTAQWVLSCRVANVFCRRDPITLVVSHSAPKHCNSLLIITSGLITGTVSHLHSVIALERKIERLTYNITRMWGAFVLSRTVVERATDPGRIASMPALEAGPHAEGSMRDQSPQHHNLGF